MCTIGDNEVMQTVKTCFIRQVPTADSVLNQIDTGSSELEIGNWKLEIQIWKSWKSREFQIPNFLINEALSQKSDFLKSDFFSVYGGPEEEEFEGRASSQAAGSK